MTLGKRDLKGFVPSIKDRGLGAKPGDGGRAGFAGISKGGDKTLFYEFKSLADAVATLVRGPAVDQLTDFFDDGYDPKEPSLSVKSVVYREIDPTGGTAAAPGTPLLTAGGTGTGTCTSGGVPYRERTYCIKITASGNIGAGTVRYRLCRNYDVVDVNHQYWEPEQRMAVTAVGPPAKCKIFLEDPGSGNFVEFTDNVVPAGSFVVGDLWTWTTAPALPTVAKTVAALTDLAQWRDAGNNGIGGAGDITMIGTDRPFASADWDDVHAIATYQWNNNIHPVQFVISTPLAVKALGLYVIDAAAADWAPQLVTDSLTYRVTTIPTNSALNGALEVSVVWGLTDKSTNQDGPQVRHKCGSILGMKARGRWHWNIHWTDRFPFVGMKAVYPWNSPSDNMTIKAASPENNRLAVLSVDGHFITAVPGEGYVVAITVDNEWAMADLLSDYFLGPYFRIVGATHITERVYFAAAVNGAGSPGISSNDAVVLEAEMNAVILKPRTVDPNKSGDSVIKPYNAANIHIWAESDVLVTQTLVFSQVIVPTGSKRQLAGYTQLARSL